MIADRAPTTGWTQSEEDRHHEQARWIERAGCDAEIFDEDLLLAMATPAAGRAARFDFVLDLPDPRQPGVTPAR